jgi:hypothetical protein
VGGGAAGLAALGVGLQWTSRTRPRPFRGPNRARHGGNLAESKQNRHLTNRIKEEQTTHATRPRRPQEGNIIDEKRERRRAQLDAKDTADKQKKANRVSGGAAPKPFDPLDRFAPPPPNPF